MMFDRLKPRSRLLRWLAEVTIFAAVFLGIQAWQQRDIPSGKAPQTGGYLANGQAFCLNDWREHHPGQTVALHFWADWCPICKSEEGNVTAVARDWPVITVAMQSGTAERVAAHLRKEGLAWSTLVDNHGRISADYGLKGVPAFVVIDRNGIIRSVSTGYTSEIGMRVRLWWADHF
jgi:thiol-disulfide isomerase/thioredoxin